MIDSKGDVFIEHELPQYETHETLRHILTGGPICSACYSLMFDRRCIDAVGFYSETWRYTQDVDMLTRLARRFPLIRVPAPLMQVRQHEQRGILSKAWQDEVPRFSVLSLETSISQNCFRSTVPAPRGYRGPPATFGSATRWPHSLSQFIWQRLINTSGP
jgi:hypothetical protein